MSFILDALRKSESQRRLDAVPELMRVAAAVPRERLPVWAVLVIAALAIALVAVIVVGWREQRAPAADAITSLGTSSTPAVAVPPPATRSLTEPSGSEPRDTSGLPTAPATPPPAAASEVVTERSAPPITPPTELRPMPPVAPAVADPATPSPPPTSTARRSLDTSALPSVAALRAAGVMIPALDLQLLVTSSTPSSRFVVINGSRYREGERLREGPELVEVLPEGAVLRQAGTEFLLVTD